MFGSDRAIRFVVMATPEDVQANAEYIRLADEFIEVCSPSRDAMGCAITSQCRHRPRCVLQVTVSQVPGGANHNNYANVNLIVDIAERTGVQAVWAGWGHASENPKLPDSLACTAKKIAFIGPPGRAMNALGDKIGSTLIAQSVPPAAAAAEPARPVHWTKNRMNALRWAGALSAQPTQLDRSVRALAELNCGSHRRWACPASLGRGKD